MSDVQATPIDLEALHEHLDTAADLLARAEPASVSSAGQRLASVESLLGDLLADPGPVTPRDANWFLITRNDLSVHLSAAGTLDAEGLHGRAAALLEGAIHALRARLDGRPADEVTEVA
ncbi:MAG: hypothetical protein ACRD12_18065 [Acidimicrobiales bacterium]